MKKSIQPRQTTALVLGLTAGVLLAACSGPEPTPWVEEQYQEHAADIKKIFGNEVKEDSVQTYVATKVGVDIPEWEGGGGWNGKYEITLKTTTMNRKVGTEELPMLKFTSIKYPPGLPAAYLGLVPAWGSLALGKKSDDEIPVTRYFGSTRDEKFKDGKLMVVADGHLLLKCTYRVFACAEGDTRCFTPTWTFELKKKE